MSVFDPTTETTPDTVTLETLVGEGKKYATPDDVAKAKVHADLFIEQLKAENAGLREDLALRLTAEEQLSQFAARQTAAPVRQDEQRPATQAPAVPDPAIKKEDLASLVREITSQERQAEQALRNANEIEARMLAEFGDEQTANRIVQAKAQELGVSVEFLQSVALQSPKAFFTTLGLEAAKDVATPQTRGKQDVNTEAFMRQNANTTAPVGSYKYYEDLRKNDPKTYWSPKTQNQIYGDRLRLGDDFWKGSARSA